PAGLPITCLLLMSRRPPIPPLFPYTTLFRSRRFESGRPLQNSRGYGSSRSPFVVPSDHRVTMAPPHNPSPARPHAAFISARRRRSEEHTSELQSLTNLVCRLLLENKKPRPAP